MPLAEVVRAVLVGAIGVSSGTERPVATALRVDRPPVIDGRLDEPVWSQAPSIGPFTQQEPDEGAPPTQPTDVRVLYDNDYLYIGIRCFDSEPENIIATQMGRDADLDTDDRVMIVIDTFLDRRNAFFFEMNPAGAKVDALIQNNGQDFNEPWDGIWEGKGSIDDKGWVVEIAIPFKTLNFKPGLDTWGFNVGRNLKRRREASRWASARLDVGFQQVSEAGDVRGLVGMQQGVGLDIKPFFVGRWTNDRSGEPNESLQGQPGFDLFYKVTPSLQASLTVNTDFAETEVDQRRVNLTRFPLFFPEKRDFFLQDAGIFKFADLGNDLIPFFSRRIGLTDDGDRVPIRFGGKLTGRESGYNIGLLDVETGSAGNTPERNLLAARVSRNVGDESTIGGIVTRGNPSETGENALYWLDANYRTSSFGGDKNLVGSMWGLQTYTSGESGADLAYGATIAYPNDLWNWEATVKEIQTNFNPALGFVPRTGIRQYTGELAYEPRPNGVVRQLFFGSAGEVVTGIDNEIQSADAQVKLIGLEFDSGDEARLLVLPDFERLDKPFDIHDGISIPAGDFTFTRYRAEVETALKRPVSGLVAVEVGEFFDGHRTDVETQLDWRPSRYFTGSLAYEQNHVWLPDGHFTVHIGSVRANIAFSPELSWSNFVQADNESNTLGVNSRVRWILTPGQELFFVVNHTIERQNGAVDPLFEEVAIKLEYTIRF
ncbi:MAG: carbohydrate binding family 9 domain-containing protein [Planctomycetes bacterium]|nr:carbohydrate binding family 9 domain-containing protein [Planctomycetota bacterium]